MSYLLGLSFQYHRYQKDAIMRIYADDHLLDELRLHQDINLKVIDKSKTPVYRHGHGPLNFCYVALIPEKFFLFEINETYLSKSISIEVENNNNNYTNGFMSHYSYIKLHDVFLLPKSLLKYENWKPLLAKPDGANHEYNSPFPIDTRLDDLDFKVRHSSNPWISDLTNHLRGGNFSIEIPVNQINNHRLLGGKDVNKKLPVYFEPLYILSLFKQLNI